MGILGQDSQAALVRTWGRSYARLAEWQVSLLAGIAVAGPDPDVRLAELAAGVLPRVEALQSYVWRRHLSSAASRLLTTGSPTNAERMMAVCFVDIVGYTTQSKSLAEDALVEWIEGFEQVATGTVVDHGGRVIKTIGDEILFTADDPAAAAEIALALAARGLDDDDPFPAVRAGIAYGIVVNRLGDVFGPTVNIAARLTSVARPAPSSSTTARTPRCPATRTARTQQDGAGRRRDDADVPATASGGCDACRSRATPGSRRGGSSDPRPTERPSEPAAPAGRSGGSGRRGSAAGTSGRTVGSVGVAVPSAWPSSWPCRRSRRAVVSACAVGLGVGVGLAFMHLS